MRLTRVITGYPHYGFSPLEKPEVDGTIEFSMTPEEAVIMQGLMNVGNAGLLKSLKAILSPKKEKGPQFGGAFYNENGEMVYIKKVIYNNPATVVMWSDNTKTSSVCKEGDTYNPEMGLTLAVLKKVTSSDFAVKTLNDWIPREGQNIRSLKDVRKEYKNTEKKEEKK